MEDYPEELRTPPVALISLVGCAELHQMISTHLHSQKPPVNTLALPDFTKISVMGKNPKGAGDSNNIPPPVAGILKRDWLVKHRTKVPGAVAALFRSDHISGDPAQWLQLCTDLDQLKAVIRPRNIKLVLIVVQSKSKDEINEDRMAALRKRAEVDSKYIVTFSLKDEAEKVLSLERLSSSFTELVNMYYLEEGRRMKMRIEKKSLNTVEFSVWYCFKVAVFAEFRRDWVEALKFYEDAYYMVREMIKTSTRLPPIQRLVEIKTVAEQLHFKISTLLLHGGKIIEAVMWFRQHFSAYKRFVGPPDVTFLHWEWISKQFLVFAELLETSAQTIPGFHSVVSAAMDKASTDWELQPVYYYQMASHYLREKRSSFEVALSMSEASNTTDGGAESLIPSLYIGQYARLLELGDDTVVMQSVTDEDFACYSISEGKRSPGSFEIIALLKKSYDIYSSLKAMRMASICGLQMAKEYFHLNDIKKAKYYFDSIVGLYRQEGWVTLLWEILGYLRECSRTVGSLKEFVEYSLEMAALPVSSDPGTHSLQYKDCGPAGPPSSEQREIIQTEVLSLLTGESGHTSDGDHQTIKLAEGSPLLLEIDLISPLRVALLASAAFHEQMVKPGTSVQIALSLLSQLPNSVEIDALDIQFNQSDCNFTILNASKHAALEKTISQAGSRIASAPMLIISQNKWLRLTYDVKSDQSGKLECLSVVVKIGSRFSICCRAESPASMGDLPLWKFEERVEAFPTKDTALSFSGQKATQIDEPDPQVEVTVNALGPALVGESFIVPVIIAPKGHSIHSGELKINLVDNKGGGLASPREMEPHSAETHHVELVKIFESDGSHVRSENIEKIQPSFGLISVPVLEDGDTWSCKLEIKWRRPKPVMIYVSLGYSPYDAESNGQKVHVHRSLQVEGKTPLVVSHRVMLPFRRDNLLLSRIKPAAGFDGLPSLPRGETSILVVNAKNCTEVPLRLLSISIEPDEDPAGSSCEVLPANNSISEADFPPLLVPGEEYKKVISIVPVSMSSRVQLGTFCLRWIRDGGFGQQCSTTDDGFLIKHRLPDVNVEFSPLIVCLECPPHAILGAPFTCFIKIRNLTELLQEIKLSLVDSHSFVSCGFHNDTIFVLPKAEHILSHKLVPLASGPQQLPSMVLTAIRYSAAFQSSVSASTIYVFPLKPEFKTKTAEPRPETGLLTAE